MAPILDVAQSRHVLKVYSLKMYLPLIAKALALITTANVAPLFAKMIFGGTQPLDAGLILGDGRRLLGSGKTIGGLTLALIFTPFCAWLIGLSPLVGILTATAAMAGDLISSFIKRRLALPSGAMAPGLDQIPESLLPMLVLRLILPFHAIDIALVCAIFLVGEFVFARVFFHLHLRDRPY